MSARARLTALIEGSLAANIFDWGAAACVELYHNGAPTGCYRCPNLSTVARSIPHAYSHVFSWPLLLGSCRIALHATGCS